MGGGLLDKGHLTLRQREIVIHRVTGQCGSEYEWGVHVAFFAKRAGLDAAQLRSHRCTAAPSDACWSAEDALLIRFCDALHATATIDDALWAELRAVFSEEAILELLLLAGFYRTVSYLTNALRLPLEPFAARFPDSGEPVEPRHDVRPSSTRSTRSVVATTTPSFRQAKRRAGISTGDASQWIPAERASRSRE